MVIGSLAADTSCDYSPFDTNVDASPVLHTSNPASIAQSAGGVGRNVATAAQYAGAQVSIASVVANDLAGQTLIQSLKGAGIDTSPLMVLDPATGARTAQYVAVNDMRKDLMLAMGDFSVFSRPELEDATYWIDLLAKQEPRPKWIVIDGNWSANVISNILRAAEASKVPVAFEPVSTVKAARLFQAEALSDVIPQNMVSIASPNKMELAAMHTAAAERGLMQSESWWNIIDSFGLSSAGSRDKFQALAGPELADEGIPQQIVRLLPFVPNIITKLGARGCLLGMVLRRGDPRLTDPVSAPYILSRTGYEGGVVGGLYMRLFSPAEVVQQHEIVSVNGVGDTLLGVVMAGLVREVNAGQKPRLEEVLSKAQEAAVMTLKSRESVSPRIQEMSKRN